MTTLLLVGAAAAFGWPWLRDHWHQIDIRKIPSHYAAVVLLAAAAWMQYRPSAPAPGPTPPPPPAALSLRGLFTGADAAADAAILGALCGELADEIEWDSKQPEPLLKTGVALDELRIRSRVLLVRGVSLGQKYPLVRDAIDRHLTAIAGRSGGPLTPEARAKWVQAFRDIAAACEDAR